VRRGGGVGGGGVGLWRGLFEGIGVAEAEKGVVCQVDYIGSTLVLGEEVMVY
jgi:hypothetical protein